MKRINQMLALLIIGAMTLIFSCSKEETKSEVQNQPAQTTYEQLVIKAIQSFKEKVVYRRENPVYKSGELVSTDSVLWYLEATLNYSHCFPAEFYKSFEIDTVYIAVGKNPDGTVSLDELVQKYNDLKTAVTSMYYNSSFEEKGLAMVDLTESSQNDSEIIFLAETVTGERGIDPPPPDPGVNGPFEEGDNWWYGETLGECDPHTYDTDAAEQLFNAMNSYIASQNVNVGFPEITSRTIKGGTTNSFNRLFSTYEFSGVPFNDYDELCMDWQDLNVHFNDMKYLIYTKLQNENVVPAGYKPVELTEFLGDQEPAGNGIHYYHKYTCKFGFPIYRGYDGPEEL